MTFTWATPGPGRASLDKARRGFVALAALAACTSPYPNAQAGAAAKPPAVRQVATQASSSFASDPLFGESVGVHVKFAEGQPESELATLSDLGVRWVRDSVPWHKLEPRPGDFRSFPPDFARRVAFYKEHQIGLVFILAFANEAAYPATKDEPLRAIDPVRFAAYAVEVARRLKQAGLRFVLEVWNEPHHFTVRQVAGGAWNGAPPSPWIHHYVRMVAEVTRRIKQLDPSIPLLDDDDMWVLHYRFMEAGLPAKLDGFAIHPYTRHQPAADTVSWFSPEHTAIRADTPWVLPFVAVDDDASFESAVRRLRETGARGRASAPEIWITEWGWKLGDPSSDGPITEDLVAAYLPRAYVLAANAGVHALCWFSLEDRNDGPWGLIANDGRRRKPYYALRTLTRQLAAFSFVGRLAGATHRTAGAQAFLFCRRGATETCTVIAWNIDNPHGRIQLSGPLAAATASDLWGTPIVPHAEANGVPTLPLGTAPVYLSGLSGQSILSPGLVASVEASLE